MNELNELAREYDRLCQRVEPSEFSYTFQTERQDVGSPHVEFADGEYHYIVTERGLDLERKSTTDIREMLYWMLYDLTFWMGVSFELKNRVEGPDCRRVIFAHQLELMKRADSKMAERLEQHISKTLSANPFIDRY
ncbi:MAG: Imm63 family immunity protein [Pyrinomonadaceae bacterium]